MVNVVAAGLQNIAQAVPCKILRQQPSLLQSALHPGREGRKPLLRRAAVQIIAQGARLQVGLAFPAALIRRAGPGADITVAVQSTATVPFKRRIPCLEAIKTPVIRVPSVSSSTSTETHRLVVIQVDSLALEIIVHQLGSRHNIDTYAIERVRKAFTLMSGISA